MDWVPHRTDGRGRLTRKRTVIAEGAGWVAVGEEYLDAKVPPVEYTVRLAGSNPAVGIAPKAANDAPLVEVLGFGKATVMTAGRKYECAWTKTMVTTAG